MQWFAGNVQTAIQISRKNRALLIVYISSDSEDGRRFDGFWDHIDAGNLQCPVVGIKLKDGETAARQFAEIYPTPILPAAYLIDQSGKPLEVITSLVGTEYDQFRAKFDKAVTEFVKNLGGVAATAPPALAPVAPAPAAPVAQAPPSAPLVAPVAPQPAARAQMDPELAEKVRRAKELLEQKKQKDLEKKREAEKHQKEELTKAQQAKQERDDKALLEAAKQRKMEKLEAGKEKERILAQIKADREDAQKRFGKAQAPKPEAVAPTSSSKPPGQSVPSDRCRLQIRLPDGSTFVEEFPSNDVLNSLVEIIRQKLNGSNYFDITQTYPRRVFSADDYSKTFLENQLTPSTALVVVAKPSPTAAISSTISTQTGSIFSLVLSPVWLFWNFFCGLLGWNSGSGGAGEPKPQGSGAQGAQRQRGMPRSAEVRRRGNVAGLVNPNDDDPEERANFNGNSTQFM